MFPLFGMHSAPGSEPRSPQATDSQIDAAVILGAGFDTRAYRLPVLAATPVYEIDLPANIDRKRTRLTKLFGGIPANVTLVPIDVETQDLADVSATTATGPSDRLLRLGGGDPVSDGSRCPQDLRLSRHRGSGQPPGFHLCRPVAARCQCRRSNVQSAPERSKCK
jgi:Leucine carboxyl methyltransferase